MVYTDKSLPFCGRGTLAWQGSGTSTTVTGLDNGVAYTFGVCPIDAAGNAGKPATVVQRPATEYAPPTGSVVVAGGATYVGKGRLELAISASDASGVAQMCEHRTVLHQRSCRSLPTPRSTCRAVPRR